MKLHVFLLIKMTLGFIVGMLIAYLLKLPYFYTAGVIAVLSFEPTRKASMIVGLKRMIASLLALSLGLFMFTFFGFHMWVLFLLVGMFIPLAFLFKVDKGIIVALVLVSQIYLEKDVSYTFNAFYILVLGLGVAMLLNLYVPKNPHIKEEITLIDQSLNTLIQSVAYQQDVSFIDIDTLLNKTYKNIQIELEDINVEATIKRLKYVEMRIEQVAILKRIDGILKSVEMIDEKDIILNFLKTFNGKIGEDNYAKDLREKLDGLFLHFKESDLPQSREAFEKRAQLYFVLLEIDQFLNVKLLYHQAFN